MATPRGLRQAVKVEHGIPIPTVLYPGRRRTYPFTDMKEGDSFFVAITPEDRQWAKTTVTEDKGRITAATLVARRLRASARYYGVRVKTAARTEEGKDGVRVWRAGDVGK